MSSQDHDTPDVTGTTTATAPWSDQGDPNVSTLVISDSDEAGEELPGVEQVPEYVPLSTRATAEAGEESGEETPAIRLPVDADYADDPEFFKQVLKAAKSIGKVVKRGVDTIGGTGTLTAVASAFGVPPPVAAAVGAFLAKTSHRRETEGDDSAADPSLLEVVIGADDRVRVNNTAITPWSGICHLAITAANGQRFLGTGWMIAPRCVITAGHCVFIRSAGGWVRNVQVTAGRNGATAPFGRVDATRFSALPRWVSAADRNFDCGCIILPRAPRSASGASPFRFGYAAKSDAAIRARALNVSGYPGDKGGVTQWFHARMAKAVSPSVITYDIDTAGGQSGSPVWHLENGVRTAVGIHTNGSPLGNSATRITPALKAQFDAWRAAATP